MLISKTASAVTFFLSLASGIQSVHAENVERGTIQALLRSAHQRAGLSRRASCSIGFFACEDGTGCCPVTQYCGEWDGILGCCPIGFTCGNGVDDRCNKSGYVRCAGDDFCCPAGGLCSRDINDNPKCYDVDGAPAPVAGTTSAPLHTSTKTTIRTTSTHLVLTTSTSVTFGFESVTITGPFNGDDFTSTSTSSIPKITITAPSSSSSIAMATYAGGTNIPPMTPTGIPGLNPNGATTMFGFASTVTLFACVMVNIFLQ